MQGEQAMNEVMTAGIVIYIGIMGIIDYRKHSVSLAMIVAAALAVVIANVYTGNMNYIAMAAGMVPAILLYFSGVMTGGAIGSGDAALLAIIGGASGAAAAMLTLAIGSTFAAVFSAVMLMLKKIRLNQQLPFIPFMCIGYMGVILLG